MVVTSPYGNQNEKGKKNSSVLEFANFPTTQTYTI